MRIKIICAKVVDGVDTALSLRSFRYASGYGYVMLYGQLFRL